MATRIFTLNNTSSVSNFNAVFNSSTNLPSSGISMDVNTLPQNPQITITINVPTDASQSSYHFAMDYSYYDYAGEFYSETSSSINVNVIDFSGGEDIGTVQVGEIPLGIIFSSNFSTDEMSFGNDHYMRFGDNAYLHFYGTDNQDTGSSHVDYVASGQIYPIEGYDHQYHENQFGPNFTAGDGTIGDSVNKVLTFNNQAAITQNTISDDDVDGSCKVIVKNETY